MSKAETGRDILRLLAKFNKTEIWLAKQCGVTRGTVFNWTKLNRLSVPQKKLVESVFNELPGDFIDKKNIKKYFAKSGYRVTEKFLNNLSKKTQMYAQELAQKSLKIK
ncbi:MAG: hypothetical protein ACE5HR_00370 [bacterium]